MLDINEIRKRKDELQKTCEYKNKDINISQIIFFDDKRKELQVDLDKLKHEQKEAGKNKEIEKAKSLKEKIKIIQEKYNANQKELDDLMRNVPNFVHSSVKFAKSEDDNEIIKEYGKKPVFDFEPKDHQTILEGLGLLEKEQASKVSGSRFFYLKGDIARLQFAIVNYVFSILQDEKILQKIISDNNLDISSKPFQIVVPPTIVNYDTMDKMGRLHPMDDRYCLEQDKQVLVGSAEHCLGPILMDQTINEKEFPIRLVAFTSAYRREAGTYGKDTRGLIRTHEFHKIEMESFSLPENGLGEQDLFVAIQEYLAKELGLAYQLLNKCTGDVGSMDYRAFDINVRLPGEKRYVETHTADYMTNYQSRRLKIKFKKNNGQQDFVHMNDATAFALGRIIACITENYQTSEGSIIVPEVLRPFMGGQEIISKRN